MKGHRRLSSLLAVRSYLIDALAFPPPFSPPLSLSLSISLILFLPLFSIFSRISWGKTGGRHRKERFPRPCLAVRWENRLYRTKGLFLELAWHRDALLLTGLGFIAFMNWSILVCHLFSQYTRKCSRLITRLQWIIMFYGIEWKQKSHFCSSVFYSCNSLFSYKDTEICFFLHSTYWKAELDPTCQRMIYNSLSFNVP